MKQIWALAMLFVLLAATVTGCVVRDRGRRCDYGYHWNGSFCQANRRERICAPGYHYDGRLCIENRRQRVVGELPSPNL